jgi:hypothetical protein
MKRATVYNIKHANVVNSCKKGKENASNWSQGTKTQVMQVTTTKHMWTPELFFFVDLENLENV